MPQEEYMGHLRKYISSEFKDFYPSLKHKIEQSLAILLICNNNSSARHWPSAEGLDFSMMRDVLYKFTLKRCDEFLATQEYSFLYEYYYNHGAEKDIDKQKEVPRELIMSICKELNTQ
mmetsp:Transcript_7159/g.6351  ORF Transcript_7159/g.6351 Transcript_7159/m.6351 type:complete len:118 (+) Transcript_7159:349-702(+)